MKKSVRALFAVSLLFLVSCDFSQKVKEGIKQATDEKATLQKRYDDLADLNEKLEKKKEEILELHESFLAQIESLEAEIKDIVRSENIEFYNQTLSNQRIKFDLKLLQQKRAYIKKITEFYERLLLGSEEVLFLTRKTESDLQVVQVLNEEDIEGLIRQINRVVKEYLPYADKLAIKVSPDEMEAEKDIFKTILEGSDQTKTQSKEITQRSKYSDNYRIIRLIKQGKMDTEWYQNTMGFILNVYNVEDYNSRRESFFWPEKIIFIKPYIILGATLEEDFDESIGSLGVLLDGQRKKYLPEKIIGDGLWDSRAASDGWASWGKEEEIIIRTETKEIKRIFFIYPYEDPEKFKTGFFLRDRRGFVEFNSVLSIP